ncbi:MAG: hypothetical protein K2Q10_07930, partial [Rhodospirillales bacterium]|nr:hypothetical protein [Rhodospirillales bacterium]
MERWLRTLGIERRISLLMALSLLILVGIAVVGWHGAAVIAAQIGEAAGLLDRGRQLASIDHTSMSIQVAARHYIGTRSPAAYDELQAKAGALLREIDA